MKTRKIAIFVNKKTQERTERYRIKNAATLNEQRHFLCLTLKNFFLQQMKNSRPSSSSVKQSFNLP